MTETTQRDEELERLQECWYAALDRANKASARAETAEAERDLQRQETEAEHDRAEAAEAKLAAVRELHQPEDWRSEVLDCVVPGCSACGSGDYPCPTIRTLDGDGDE